MGLSRQPAQLPSGSGTHPPAGRASSRWTPSLLPLARPRGPAWRALLGLALCTLLLAPGRAAAQASLAPLGESDSQLLQALPEEKPYNVRIHFLRSNERRHDVFFPALRHLGGGYIGVGADQNYTLAAV